MKNNLYLFFAQKEWFWKTKGKLAKNIFKIKAKVFNVKNSFSDNKKDYSYFQSILKITQSSIFLAFIFAVILQLTNGAVYEFFQLLKPYVPAYILMAFETTDNGDYTAFLLAIAAVGGVFIGLHYAGMSTLNGSLYARLPNNIRNLLIQERFGNVYIKFLSFLTYLAFIFAAFRVSGFEHIYLIPLLIIIAMGVGVFAFVDLGKRVFYLFDPTILSPIIFDEMNDKVKKVQIESVYAHDKSIQKHNNRLLKDQLDTLVTLLTVAKEESSLSGNSLVTLSQSTLSFLQKYQYMKQKIPSKSLWYDEKYSHKDWYRMDDIMTDMSYRTGTTPTADIIYEYFWIEKRVLPFIVESIEINIKDKKFNMAHSLLNDFSQYLQNIVFTSDVSYAYKELDKLQLIMIETIKNNKDKDIELEMIGILEALMNIPIELALVFYQSLEQYSYSLTSSRLKNINWLDKSDIYNHKFNSYVLPQLEWLSEKLLYESKIENRVITPHWYQLEIIMLIVSERFIENLTYFTVNLNDFYSSALKETDVSKVTYFRATILAKKLEYSFKLNDQFYKVKTLLETYISNRKINDLKWSQFDLPTTEKNLKDNDRQLLKEISKTSLLIGFLDRKKDYPDFFGQFLHITGESLIDALNNNDLDLFSEIYPVYFYSSILKFENLKPQMLVTDWRLENELKIAAAPIMDMIDISGYSKLFSEYYNEEKFWSIVQETWNQYLQNPELKIKPEFFVSTISVSESGFGLGHRSTSRFNWSQKVEYKLSSLEKQEVYDNSGAHMAIMSPKNLINHKSALVRFFAKGRYGTSHDGIDIFIEYYLKSLDVPDTLTFGRRDYKDLARSIELEKEFYEKEQRKNTHEN